MQHSRGQGGDMLSEEELHALVASQSRRCVLIVDVVESVRLIQHDESGAIARWLSMV